MNTHGKVELALIPVAVAGVAAGAPWLPTRVGVGELLTAAVLATGFALREVVITWRPFGLRREPDHHTIVFTWW